MRRRTSGLVVVLLCLLGPASTAGAATTLLRLDGIGPVKLGMTRAAAVKTGWLADRAPGCELASPRPITYRFTGPKAPGNLRGSAQFERGRLSALSFNGGVRTRVGVRIGAPTGRMVSKYRNAGFAASSMFSPVFAGTFVSVQRERGGRQVLGAFAKGGHVRNLAVPAVPVCE
jgi:hypothetical protein